MQPFPERVKTIFEALNTSTHKFAKDHDFSRTSLFNVVSGRNQPVFGLVERICAVEPRISAEYLLRGQGEPLRDQQQALLVGTAEELESLKAEVVATFDRRIQELRR